MDLEDGPGIQGQKSSVQLCPLPHQTQDGFQGPKRRRLGTLSSGVESQLRNSWVRCLPFGLWFATDTLTMTSSYEIYWFREGTFERIGDGGWLNVRDISSPQSTPLIIPAPSQSGHTPAMFRVNLGMARSWHSVPRKFQFTIYVEQGVTRTSTRYRRICLTMA